MDFKAYLNQKTAIINSAMDLYILEPEGPAADVMHAMKYSLFAGGKRLRPILCIAGAEAVGGAEEDVIPVACALELIHTYSLIHDDLPMMDDDNLRRGKPANHKVFGEAIAILAGDGLLTEAFGLMAGAGFTERILPGALLKVIALIAKAAGYRGMVGGQTVDIQSEGKTGDPSLVEYMHSRKTGDLLAASVISGAILGGGNESEIEAVTSYGHKTGLAYQISDDILDIYGNSNGMGKPAGADEKRGKMTYPAVLGMKESKAIRAMLVKEATESLQVFDSSAEPLREIARYIIERET